MTSPGFASSKALARFHLLQPHLEEDFPLARIAAECGVAERTLRRWLAAWRAKGIQGLERARRSDAGNRRMLDPDLEGLVRSMATKRPRPTAAAIHRKIQAEAKARGIAGISYSVVASIVRGIEPARIAIATDAAREHGGGDRERSPLCPGGLQAAGGGSLKCRTEKPSTSTLAA